MSFIRNHHDYLDILPILDTLAPTVEPLEQVVSWIMIHLAHESVFIHCALGHGRSIIIAGFILKSGMMKNSNEAINFVKSKRKNLHLSSIQRRVLEQYQQNLESK